MAWESRNGRQYYYIKRRINGRVQSIYLGAGPMAELAAIQQEETTQALKERRQTEQAAQDAELRIDSLLDTLGGQVEAILAEWMQANGYHEHRGQWRRRR